MRLRPSKGQGQAPDGARYISAVSAAGGLDLQAQADVLHRRISSLQGQLLEQLTSSPDATPAQALALAPRGWTWGGFTEYAKGEGQKVLAPDWDQRMTQDGLPWAAGLPATETNPELAPYLARGLTSQPSVWADLAKTPAASQALEGPVKALGALRVQVDAAAAEPWHGTLEAGLVAKHHSHCLQLVAQWGARATSQLIEDLLRTPPLYGFGLWEVAFEQRWFSVNGQRQLLPAVQTPHWIAPSSVRWWVTERGQPVGVVLDSSAQVDGASRLGLLGLPWEKLLWVGFRASGSNLEGESLMRPVFRELQMYRTVRQLQVLALEINALGDKVVTLGDKTSGAVLDALKGHFRSFVARLVPYLILPPGCTYQWISGDSAVPDFGPVLDQLRKDLATALDTTSNLLGVNSPGGSYALKVEADAGQRQGYLWLWRRCVSQPLAEVFARALQLAFPDDGVWFPGTLRPEDTQARDSGAWATTAATLETAGLLRAKGVVGREARQKVGLPPDLPDDEYLSQSSAPQPSAPQPPAGPYLGRLSQVVDAEGRTLETWRALRPSERHLALSALDDLYSTAISRAAGDFALVAAQQEVWQRGQVSDPLTLTADEAGRLLETARARFGQQYAAGLSNALARGASEMARLLRAEVQAAGALVGPWSSQVTIPDGAGALAVSAVNVTWGAVSQAQLSGLTTGAPGSSYWSKMVGQTVSSVLARVRTQLLEVNQSSLRPGRVERSALLDRNTCEQCKRLDGQSAQLGSAEAFALQPPRGCLGRGACRCLLVWVSDDEGQPA